jgi:hypothetical protein
VSESRSKTAGEMTQDEMRAAVLALHQCQCAFLCDGQALRCSLPRDHYGECVSVTMAEVQP